MSVRKKWMANSIKSIIPEAAACYQQHSEGVLMHCLHARIPHPPHPNSHRNQSCCGLEGDGGGLERSCTEPSETREPFTFTTPKLPPLRRREVECQNGDSSVRDPPSDLRLAEPCGRLNRRKMYLHFLPPPKLKPNGTRDVQLERYTKAHLSGETRGLKELRVMSRKTALIMLTVTVRTDANVSGWTNKKLTLSEIMSALIERARLIAVSSRKRCLFAGYTWLRSDRGQLRKKRRAQEWMRRRRTLRPAEADSVSSNQHLGQRRAAERLHARAQPREERTGASISSPAPRRDMVPRCLRRPPPRHGL
ncbi:hypothetical protein F2P81_021929 [Scophthalmus maximus]|uniref:Uncharacterized protein n=1 Tax=Scophthalmus maximus TaxID=52904 RepID=A0A6A4RYR2_SCOMX|nr:hypothetical protein F2P81_021929 [Scophthalmus maximus]